jgi:hypothetical protein
LEHEYVFNSLSQIELAIPWKCRLTENSGVQKVLKPDVFQNFELKEKTIVSHNVAMSVKPLSSITAC